MPYYVVEKAGEALDRTGKSLCGAKILILGVAYKKDVDDKRESPALRIIQLLAKRGAEVVYHDPHVPMFRGLRHYPEIEMKSVGLTEDALGRADLVVLVTDHTAYDYAFIEKHAKCIVDTRNAFERNGIGSGKIIKA